MHIVTEEIRAKSFKDSISLETVDNDLTDEEIRAKMFKDSISLDTVENPSDEEIRAKLSKDAMSLRLSEKFPLRYSPQTSNLRHWKPQV